MNHDIIKACVLPQIKTNLSGEIISHYYHYREDKEKLLSVTVTSEHFNEQEMNSQLRACDLDMVLSYYKFDSNSIENKELYTDKYSFYRIVGKNSEQSLDDVRYLAMLDLGSSSNNNVIVDFIEKCRKEDCNKIKSMPRLILPDIESLLKVSRELPIILLLNNASFRAFVREGVEVELIQEMYSLELPVYMSYHKMNPKKKMLNMVSKSYLTLLKGGEIEHECLVT